MIAAVSMRVVEAVGYSEPRDAVSHALLQCLAALNVTPVLVPNTVDARDYLRRVKVDRLVLSSGEDIVSDVAGPVEAIDNARDRTESMLLDAALAARMPVLGICRGAMLINLRLGGGLTHDLETAVGEQHVARTHEIQLLDGRSVQTNSFHRHGILRDQLAPSLRELATSPRGVVEAFCADATRLLGVIWHPERPGSCTDLDTELIGSWLK